MRLGDIFFHDLNVLAQKNTIITDQEKSLKKLIGEALIIICFEAQQKFLDGIKARKDEADKIQTDMDQLSIQSKQSIANLEKKNMCLEAEMEELKESIHKGQIDAYSTGFLDYLSNFLPGNPNITVPYTFSIQLLDNN